MRRTIALPNGWTILKSSIRELSPIGEEKSAQGVRYFVKIVTSTNDPDIFRFATKEEATDFFATIISAMETTP
jgi:hypothetical protein